MFERINRGMPKLICDSTSKDEDSFEYGSITLEIEGLRLHIVNDRGLQTVEVGLQIVDPLGPLVHPALEGFKDGEGEPTCPLEVLAVTNGWVSLDRLIKHYDLNGVRLKEPNDGLVTGPFFRLTDVVQLLRNAEKWDQLVTASTNHRMQLEAGHIEEVLQRKFAEILDAAN
ncbi:MAG: hypothetical protein OXG08_06145 [Gammaproteobacteria bacterium]|nr:hypothetical protein [Gammaproteobacteria bacterium]